MTDNDAQHNPDPPLRLLMAFHNAFEGVSPTHILQAPGREMWVAAHVDGEEFHLHAPDLDGRTVFTWRSAKNKRTNLNRPLPKWARFPAGVIVRLCAAGMDVSGVQVVVAGDEAGMRYNYAVAIAIAALWHQIHEREYTTDSLIEIVEKVRRDYMEA